MKKTFIIVVVLITTAIFCPVVYAQDGYIDLSIYIYSGGELASGYRVQIDETVLVSDENGKVDFKQLTVESHSIVFTNKDGKQSVGKIVLSPADSTEVTGGSIGGEYAINISNSANNAYMEVKFIPDFSIEVIGISQTPPTLPQKPENEDGTSNNQINFGSEDNDEKESEGGFTVTPTVLIATIVVCVIIIALLIIMLKKKNGKENNYTNEPRNTTGGKNKFDDRTRF